MRFSTLIGLIACNVIWSLNPTMSKFVLADFPPAQAAWIRYGGALVAYGIAVLFLPRFRFRDAFALPRSGNDASWIAVLGFFAFCFSPLTQLFGLASSQAIDGSLIVAMEPLVSVFLAWAFLRERLAPAQSVAFLGALTGFALLSGIGGKEARILGDFLLLVSLLGEAGFSVLGRKLVSRYRPTAVFGSALFVGVAGLTLASFVAAGVPAFSHFTWRSALAALWIGPLGTAATYLYWMFALVELPVATITLTLFIQPVSGAFWGHFFLGEDLNSLQSLGGALIVGSVFSSFWFPWRRKNVAARKKRVNAAQRLE